MVLPGHIAGGYLIANCILAVFHPELSSSQATTLLVLGTLAGEFPDIDLLFFSIANNPKQNHREYITHKPLFWLIISLAIVALGKLIASDFVSFGGWMILAGTWTHFILDSFEFGIKWLWPFVTKRFALIHVYSAESENPWKPGSVAYYLHKITKDYIGTPSFYLETMITLAALYTLVR